MSSSSMWAAGAGCVCSVFAFGSGSLPAEKSFSERASAFAMSFSSAGVAISVTKVSFAEIFNSSVCLICSFFSDEEIFFGVRSSIALVYSGRSF